LVYIALGLGMRPIDVAWTVLKQERQSEYLERAGPELVRLHQRMNELVAEFDRLSAMRANRGASRELDLQLNQVTTEMHYLEGEIAMAEQPREPPQYTEDEDEDFDYSTLFS